MIDHVSCDSHDIRGACYSGDILTSVAGSYYQHATAIPGECVGLVREPRNPYDPNAIAVHNSQGQKIGFLPRKLAAILAPHIDSLFISLAGRLLEPDEAAYDEVLAQTRPPFVVWVFMNTPAESTLLAETAVTSRYPQTNPERPSYDSNSVSEIEMPF